MECAPCFREPIGSSRQRSAGAEFLQVSCVPGLRSRHRPSISDGGIESPMRDANVGRMSTVLYRQRLIKSRSSRSIKQQRHRRS